MQTFGGRISTTCLVSIPLFFILFLKSIIITLKIALCLVLLYDKAFQSFLFNKGIELDLHWFWAECF